MAEHFVSIYGTEKDKVNCPFYYKIGACRHGDRCSRVHNKPMFSQTIMLTNLYHSPAQIDEYARQQSLPPPEIGTQERRQHFSDFFHDLVEEMEQYGTVDAIYVCRNLSEHLAGNTYVKFSDEEAAERALKAIRGRYYAGVQVKVEFSPVSDFREGKCRPYEKYGKCDRGDYCHFMHLYKHPWGIDDYSTLAPSKARERREAEPRRSVYRDYDRAFDYRRESQRYRGDQKEPAEERRERERDRDRESLPRGISKQHTQRDWGREREPTRSFDRENFRGGAPQQRYARRTSYEQDEFRRDTRDNRQRDNRRPRQYRQRDTYKEYDYRGGS